MLTWTLDEFKLLERRLLEQQRGFNVRKVNKFTYVITRFDDGIIEKLGKYDARTGILETYGVI